MFSQLAADNQFAVLGIVLVGVLASVHGACVHLVGDAESPTAAEAEVKRAVPVIAESAAAGRREEGTTTKSSSRHPGLGIVEEAVDLGQVVSREEVAAAVAARTHDEPGEQPLKRKKGEEVDQPAAKKKISTEGTKVTTGQRIEKPGKIAAEKKKKKKKSKGDEFDSLFSSLM